LLSLTRRSAATSAFKSLITSPSDCTIFSAIFRAEEPAQITIVQGESTHLVG
jgi:hypothetical protein